MPGGAPSLRSRAPVPGIPDIPAIGRPGVAEVAEVANPAQCRCDKSAKRPLQTFCQFCQCHGTHSTAWKPMPHLWQHPGKQALTAVLTLPSAGAKTRKKEKETPRVFPLRCFAHTLRGGPTRSRSRLRRAAHPIDLCCHASRGKQPATTAFPSANPKRQINRLRSESSQLQCQLDKALLTRLSQLEG